MSKRLLAVASLAVFALSLVRAQEQKPRGNMPNIDVSGHDMSNMNASDMHDMPGMGSDGSTHAMHSMEGHMDMGPHMKMTTPRDPKPGDEERADQVVEAARKVADKYRDYKIALAAGGKFMPQIFGWMVHVYPLEQKPEDIGSVERQAHGHNHGD